MFADFLVGLVIGLIGLVVCFAGLRAFFIALPAIGFILGFFVGADAVRVILGESFLSSLTSFIVGLVIGIIFAVLSYLFWYAGALLSAGATGALIGSGLMSAIGISSGWIVFIAAAIGGITLFVVALMLALPVYVVIVNTAFVGAAGAITGIMLFFNQIDRADLGFGSAWAMIETSWFWLIVWAMLVVTGLVVQLQTVTSITLPEEHWKPAQQTTAKGS